MCKDEIPMYAKKIEITYNRYALPNKLRKFIFRKLPFENQKVNPL